MQSSDFLTNLIAIRKVNGIGNQSLVSIINKYAIKPFDLFDFEFLKEILDDKQIDSFKSEIKENKILAKRDLEWCSKNEVKVITLLDQEYPEPLRSIYNPPVLIYVKGNLDYNYHKSIGIVGTRKYSSYGKIQCQKFSSALAQKGFTINSGLAYGIDTIAHTEAVSQNGKCLAVVGSGLQNIYPETNIVLAGKIVNAGGAIISEFDPFIPALPVNFPIRNRIIAGLSKYLLVVEADEKSGSLITARIAFDEGREVFAIPADVTRHGSSGCNFIIRKNIAKLVSKTEDLFEDIGTESKKVKEVEIDFLSEQQKKIYDLLSFDKLNADEIALKMNLEISLVNAELTELELYDLISLDDQNKYFRI
jgi:DNA processing protein